ncbi:TPA: PTS sugar transporter subunit IIA [Klebsiella variicola]|nr:PTS sugar transporter subunit IIA [Klebsiella variicola]
MIHIVVVSHGYFCREIKNSLDMIIGETSGITSVPLIPGEAPESYRVKLEEEIDRVYTEDGIVVLSDILSGTPYNSACFLARNYKMAIFSGMNLPMLITIALERENNSLSGLVELLKDEDVIGIKSIINNQMGKTHGKSSVNQN